jgi:uncharacterized protein (TIGR03435 family)
MILDAYHISPHQISGGPGWLDSERFDLEAKAEIPAEKAELRIMLQSLLAERFQLVIHRDTKEMPVYALTLGKAGIGPNLHIFHEGDPQPVPVWGSRTDTHHPTVLINGTLEGFAYLLGGPPNDLGRPVIDKTGLTGHYVGWLRWLDDDDLIPAIEEELGFRLEPQRAPVEIVVIDKIEKPSGN